MRAKKKEWLFRDFDLHVTVGSITHLRGPSGKGKSTLLRLIAGLEQPPTGTIVLNQRILSQVNPSHTVHLPPEQRRVGLIFQDLALFPHLTVRQNIEFGLDSKKSWRMSNFINRATQTDDQSVHEIIAEFGLAQLLERYPHEISGGQQQRVAIARSVAVKPELLMFDEPFSGLDSATAAQVKNSCRAVMKRYNITALYVSHDEDDHFADMRFDL